MVSEGQFVGLDWNRIARLHSQVLVSTCENSLTASRCHIKAYQDAANQPPLLLLLLLLLHCWFEIFDSFSLLQPIRLFEPFSQGY